MNADDIAARLSGGPWGDIRVVQHTGSTNADVAELARAGAPQGLVVATLDQRRGRGRLDRSWQLPPRSGLAVSLLLRPDEVPAARWPWLPLLAGVALQAAVAQVSEIESTLKWPNDVLVGDRKLAGILLERIDSTVGPAAVVGIGVNIAMSVEQLPVPAATSLAIEGAAVEPADLLVALLECSGRVYQQWCAAGGDPATALAAAYARVSSTLGARVRVQLPGGEELTGIATGIDTAGRLLVDTGAAAVVIGAGDVVHLRTGC